MGDTIKVVLATGLAFLILVAVWRREHDVAGAAVAGAVCRAAGVVVLRVHASERETRSKLPLIGALVAAAFVSVLLAQTPSWTEPAHVGDGRSSDRRPVQRADSGQLPEPSRVRGVC